MGTIHKRHLKAREDMRKILNSKSGVKSLTRGWNRQAYYCYNQQLNERDKFVLGLYFGLDILKDYFPEEENAIRFYSLKEIGDMIGVSRERVRQLKDNALRRLKER